MEFVNRRVMWKESKVVPKTVEIVVESQLFVPPVHEDAKCLEQLDGCAPEDDIFCSDD